MTELKRLPSFTLTVAESVAHVYRESILSGAPLCHASWPGPARVIEISAPRDGQIIVTLQPLHVEQPGPANRNLK